MWCIYMYICAVWLVAQLCPTLCDPMDCSPPDSSIHGDSPDKNTRVDCHALLQGIFPTQGLSLGLLHCRQILYHGSHQRSPRIPEWVACLFSRESSWPGNRTGVSCFAGRFFTSWVTTLLLNCGCCFQIFARIGESRHSVECGKDI